MKNSFERGPESWHSYDYHASMVSGGHNVFVLATWVRGGGVDDASYVWTDNTRWSADVPERPVSILPLIFYQHWIGEDPIDLREAKVSVHLRGDDLELYGAQCFFWVHGGGTRWHCTGSPIEIAEGRWNPEPSRITLTNDESLWHRSWSGKRPMPASLDSVLAEAVSYGFSFAGFSAEVTGRLSMSQFEIVS